MSSTDELEKLKIKIGIKNGNPNVEYDFLDKLGEGFVIIIFFIN